MLPCCAKSLSVCYHTYQNSLYLYTYIDASLQTGIGGPNGVRTRGVPLQ